MLTATLPTNTITDVLDAPATQLHLEDWGLGLWISMIALTLTTAVVSTFVSAILPSELGTGMSICANALFVFYGFFLHLTLRHIPHDFLVLMLALSMAIIMCTMIFCFGEGNLVSYALAVASNLAPAALNL